MKSIAYMTNKQFRKYGPKTWLYPDRRFNTNRVLKSICVDYHVSRFARFNLHRRIYVKE